MICPAEKRLGHVPNGRLPQVHRPLLRAHGGGALVWTLGLSLGGAGKSALGGGGGESFALDAEDGSLAW